MRMPIILVLMLTVAPVRAAPLQNPFSEATAVGPAELDSARGGFTTSSGVAVSLGIERIVTVDGQVVARSEMRLGDLGRLVSGQAVPAAPVADSLTTVVQNSLNDRAIGTATIIHASVAAQGLLQTMHFQSTLANAINAAAAGR
ncbi:hypothetical protein NX786_22970 [Telluria mixta]|uniref:Uncharacterized protein n=1 Tax=Telluria mixta TaxID=34071 RepID=A0ABT2C475_9BURK|nr:hypothetical protein [Telluria mixta]MCS0632195.1 hypothetical protein [Telluria mixta]WEM95040.1 hypothetical protein P0M04_26685 [Telluria mixta]